MASRRPSAAGRAAAAARLARRGCRSRRRAARAGARAGARRCGGTVGASTIEQPVGIGAGAPSSATVPPACSERLHQPSASGGAAAVAITRGACSSRTGREPPEVGGERRRCWRRVAERPLERPVEAGEVVDRCRVNSSVPTPSSAPYTRGPPSPRAAQRLHERRRLPGSAGFRACPASRAARRRRRGRGSRPRSPW